MRLAIRFMTGVSLILVIALCASWHNLNKQYPDVQWSILTNVALLVTTSVVLNAMNTVRKLRA